MIVRFIFILLALITLTGAGCDGDDGGSGRQGEEGVAGDAGPTGEDGLDGRPGTSGKSVLLNYGYAHMTGEARDPGSYALLQSIEDDLSGTLTWEDLTRQVAIGEEPLGIVTALLLNDIDTDGIDRGGYLGQNQAGHIVTVWLSQRKWVDYRITSMEMLDDGRHKFGVAYAASDEADGADDISPNPDSFMQFHWSAAYRGEKGAPGIAGAAGPQGVQGPTGPQGGQGDAGAAGPMGPIGIPGGTGSTGDQGLQGLQGPQGDQGSQGLAGSNGADGAQGVAGMQGADGVQGPTGAQGPTGMTGGQGADGASGPAGPAGQQGATGMQGIQGNPGLVGTPGAQGPIGVTGPEGPVGADGTNHDPQEIADLKYRSTRMSVQPTVGFTFIHDLHIRADEEFLNISALIGEIDPGTNNAFVIHIGLRNKPPTAPGAEDNGAWGMKITLHGDLPVLDEYSFEAGGLTIGHTYTLNNGGGVDEPIVGTPIVLTHNGQTWMEEFQLSIPISWIEARMGLVYELPTINEYARFAVQGFYATDYEIASPEVRFPRRSANQSPPSPRGNFELYETVNIGKALAP